MKKIFDFIKKYSSYILLGIVAILVLSLINQCNNSSDLKKEINRQHNNILAMTDSLTQYKDKLGRTIAEKHAYQLTQEELRDSLGFEKKKHVDVISYVNTTVGITDTIYQKTYIDRTVRDTVYLDNGTIRLNTADNFGKSSRQLSLELPYYVDSLLHTGDAKIDLRQNIFVESWLEKNAKTGETMVFLRSDYPNMTFNSGMGIVATTTPKYDKSMRKTKGIGISVGPQVGLSYDLKRKQLAPTIGIGVGVGLNYTPKWLQW